MNPILVADIGFSFFTNLFSSDDKKEEKPKKKEKPKKPTKQDITDSNKSAEITNTEQYSNIKEKEKKEVKGEKEEKEGEKETKKMKKEKEDIIKEEIIEDIKTEDTKEEEEQNIIKKEEEKNIIKIEKKKSWKKKKNKTIKKTKDQLLVYLVNFIKNVYIFRKKVKSLIQKHKDNFAIISSVEKGKLATMNIKINEEQIKKVKYVYEPILNENIFYIPRKLYKKKNLVKFSFVNKKNESIIDPKFNTEYDCGEFINVINLKKIKDKEEEREEEFQTFLESYYTIKPGYNNKENVEKNKISLGVVRVKKKHKTMDNQKGSLLFNVGKIPSNSILKQRPIKRVTSNKRISFSEKNETISYKKDD